MTFATDVLAALEQLDGTPAAALSLLTGMTAGEIQDLGGID